MFRTLFEHSLDAMLLTIPDVAILAANPAACAMFGMSEEELCRVGQAGLVDRSDPRLSAALQERARTGSVRAELTCIRRDGTHFRAEVSSALVPGERPLAVLTVRDVTERTRAEEALRAEEARHTALFELAAVGLAEGDPSGRFLDVNQKFCTITGYSRQELLQMSYRDITHPDDLEADTTKFRAMQADPKIPYRNEKRYIRKDGSVIWVETNATAVRDEHGRPVRGVAVISDITQRRAAEQAVRENRDRLALAIDAAQAGLALWDIQTDDLQWNERTYEILGHKPNSFRPDYHQWRSQVHPDDIASVEEQFWQCVKQRQDFVNEHRIIRPGGEIRWVRLMTRVEYGADGAVKRATSVLNDITSIKQAEDKIRLARDEAEAANRAKDRFLAVLSHELRTPLTPVLTTVQMLEVEESTSPEQREAMVMIRRNVELEARLIDDLLDVTRISRGKVELHLGAVDLHTKIEVVLDICRRDIQAKQLVVNVAKDAARHHVSGDAARLQQVLWNLLKNAIKFTPSGGAIAIRTLNPQAGQIRVVVEDTGIGITPEALPRIFDAFEQGSKEVTRQFGGMGLGLAISKGLAEMHHGSLRAQSEGRGRGAVFTLELPVIDAATEGRKRDSREAAPDLRNLRVLLVEDHLDTARVMTRLLRSYGCEVEAATTVADALEAGTARPHDLLICDIGLPDGSGVEVMRQLLSRGRQIRGVAVSGYGMEEDIRQSLEAGFAAHLTKPVERKTLERALRELIGA